MSIPYTVKDFLEREGVPDETVIVYEDRLYGGTLGIMEEADFFHNTNDRHLYIRTPYQEHAE